MLVPADDNWKCMVGNNDQFSRLGPDALFNPGYDHRGKRKVKKQDGYSNLTRNRQLNSIMHIRMTEEPT